MALKIRRLSNALGAEVQGLSIGEALSEEVRRELRAAFLAHGVLLFRDQDLTPEQHIAFTRVFGELDGNDAVPDYRHPDHPEIVLVTNRAEAGTLSPTRNIGRQWHSDHSMKTHPTLGSLLHAKELPEVGGDTMFANMHMAYDTLSDAMKRMLDPLWAVHDVTAARHLRTRPADYLAEKRRINPPVAQPVVRVHPETGRKALYVSEMLTIRFVGMTEEESAGLLDFLFRHSVRPEFTYRHQWRKHDLVMWDNRSTMHNALADFDQSQIRTMHRTALVGTPSGYVLDEAPAALAAE